MQSVVPRTAILSATGQRSDGRIAVSELCIGSREPGSGRVGVAILPGRRVPVHQPAVRIRSDLFIDSILQTPSRARTISPPELYFDPPMAIISSDQSKRTCSGIRHDKLRFLGNASTSRSTILRSRNTLPCLQGQSGLFWGSDRLDVNVVESTLNHGGGSASGTIQILNSYIHHNGQIGIKFSYAANCLHPTTKSRE